MSTNTTLKQVMGELAALEDPKMREANEARADDHGVNLTELRSLAKRLKGEHELALQLWATEDTAARLLATLVCKPKAFSEAELDAMVHHIRAPKLLDWFIVLIDYPTSPGCTPPYAPIWIAEMVRRKEKAPEPQKRSAAVKPRRRAG